jgi:O-methyltransferase
MSTFTGVVRRTHYAGVRSRNTSNVRGVVWKLISNPRRHFPRYLQERFRKSARLFQEKSFFLQGQMDIHPKAHWPTQIVSLTGGFFPRDDGDNRRICNLDAHDNTRRDMLILLLRTLVERKVSGAFAELGVYKGLTARLIHHYAPERLLHLFDTFEGFTKRSDVTELHGLGHTEKLFSDTSLEQVQRFIGAGAATVKFHQGFFPESIPVALNSETFAFVHLDADLYDPTLSGLRFFYPRMPRCGILVVHDYNAWPGARRAVDEFFADKPELPIPMPDKSGSAVIIKR